MAVREAPPAAPEPLSAEDLAILRLESPTVAGHTLKVAILDPPPDQPRPDVEALRTRVAERIDRAPRLRCRLRVRDQRAAEWVEDPDFDVGRRVRAIPMPGPTPTRALQRTCARMMEERLDRSQPLWAIDVIDPLGDGGIALVWRLHHSLADGAMAMRLARDVLWDEDELAARDAVSPTPAGHLVELRRALGIRRPRRLPGMLRREVRRRHEVSPLEGTVGSGRAVAFASAGLERLKQAARALVPGATINDVILSLVGGGLRRWGEARGAAIESVRVKVPVSLHASAEVPHAANRDSFFCVELPVAIADPVDRLRCIKEETGLCKQARDAQVLDALLRDMAHVAPPVRRLLDRLLARPDAFALSVSNVVGPRRRPRVLGAPVRAFHSIADVDERHGLRVAVISMASDLHFGLCADPAIVGSPEPIVDGIRADAAAIAAV